MESLEVFKAFLHLPYTWHELADLSQININNYDLVIIVNENPESFEAISKVQQLRSQAKHACIPVLFVSDKLSDYALCLFNDLDFVWQCQLPFNTAAFYKAIAEIFDFYTAQRDLINSISQIHNLLDEKKFHEALALINLIQDIYPNKFRRNLVFSRIYLEINEYGKATEFGQSALAIFPESLEANNLLASIHLKNGNQSEYKKLVASLTAMGEIMLKNFLHWGNLFLEQGQSSKSITAFEQALEKDPKNIEAKHGLLAAHLIEGRTSIVETRNFADYQSFELARLFNLKGIAMAESGNFHAAERLYQNSLRVLPYKDLAHKLWLNLGLCMKKKGQLERARDYFSKSQSHAPDGYHRAQAQLNNIELKLQFQQHASQNFAANLRSEREDKTLDYKGLDPANLGVKAP